VAARRRGYYWVAFNKVGGEIAECNRKFASPTSAIESAKDFIKESWANSGSVLVRVYGRPRVASESKGLSPIKTEIVQTPTSTREPDYELGVPVPWDYMTPGDEY